MSPTRTVPIVILLSASLVSAQQLLAEIPSAGRIGPAYDWDDDGLDDVHVGPVVYSGSDRSVLFGPPAVQYGIVDVDVLDDWNGDGVPDMVVADSDGYLLGRWVVFSGVDGSVLSTGCHGLCEPFDAVDNIGDVDGDGRDDFVAVGEIVFERDANLFLIASGGGIPFTDHGYPKPDFLDPTALGDVDGDGENDWGTLRTQFFPDGGHLEVRSLAADSIGTLDLTAATDLGFGERAALSAIGDVDGDGRDDVLVSSLPPQDFTRVISGADLSTVLLDLPFFEFLAGPGDVDCDGVPDLLLGDDEFGSNAGRVELRSGVDGSLLWSVVGAPGDRLGPVAEAGDVDGDGVPDFLVAAPGGSYTRLYSGPGPSTLGYCTGKTTSAGCTPSVDAAGTPTLTGPDDFHLLARNVLAQKPGLFFYGTNGPIAVPFLGGTLCVSPPLERTPVQLSTGALDCQAGYAFAFTQALAQAEGFAPGDTVHGQFWMRDPAQPDGTGVALSNGVAWSWCP